LIWAACRGGPFFDRQQSPPEPPGARFRPWAVFRDLGGCAALYGAEIGAEGWSEDRRHTPPQPTSQTRPQCRVRPGSRPPRQLAAPI